MPKLLLLSSNPRRDLNLDREISDLARAVQRLGKFEIVLGLGVSAQELPELIAEHSPQIVHFCGHGAGEQGLLFQDEQGREQLISTETLVQIFKTFADEINCTVLNACDSDCQAAVIAEHINYAIGMRQAILDQAAHLFSVGFYKSLGAGKSIEKSYEMGCIAIRIWNDPNSKSNHRKLESVNNTDDDHQLAEYLKPVLRKRGERLSTSLTEGNAASAVIPPPESSSDRPEEFTKFMKQEIDRKDYKDRARYAYDNFGQLSEQNTSELTKSEYKQRQILLGKVKQFWIEGFLQPSLQGTAAIQLFWKTRRDTIDDLSQGIEVLSVELDASYERLRSTRTYEEMGQGRTLLILGSPGSGKTISLLQLAQRLIERSEKDMSLPIPVVFNLSSWARDRKTIVDWAIDDLREKYQVPKSLSEPWIKQQQLILLLDGLDEVNEEYRNDCVRALNEFIELFPQTEVAICSRVQVYEALTEHLQISTALCLQPLTSESVYQFLDSVGGSLGGLKALLKTDMELEKFAQTPLILNFMSVAYQGWAVEDLIPQLRSTADRHQHLFDTYIDRRLDRGATPIYTKDQVQRWLSWLATQMLQEKRTIFLIEKMQPTWLKNQREKSIYQIRTFIFSGLISGLNGTLVGVLSLLNGLHIGLSSTNTPLIFGLTGGIVGGIVTTLPKKISPLEQLSWSWRRAKARWVSELLAGVFYGLILGLIYRLISRDSEGVYLGLVLGLIFGLVFGLVSGLGSSEIEQRNAPNQGIRSSIRNCIIMGLVGGLTFGVIFGMISIRFFGNGQIVNVGVIFGLIFGLVFGLKYGGVAWNRHFTLRQMLFQKGRIPWNYAKFLDFASDRLLMKKIGGGYVFFHRMLLEHFAQKIKNQENLNDE
jgi:NACHT domain/CHAT domain